MSILRMKNGKGRNGEQINYGDSIISEKDREIISQLIEKHWKERWSHMPIIWRALNMYRIYLEELDQTDNPGQEFQIEKNKFYRSAGR